jgi:hypothetical protein
VREAIDFLSHDARVEQAARVARVFHLDPVVLLTDDEDEFPMLVRIAAVQVVQRDKQKEAEAERRAAKKKG